jgi:DNA-binding GntR family transcriptional regulator
MRDAPDSSATSFAVVPGLLHQSIEVLVCDELRTWIISGRIPPESRLVEGSIATELGVSRGPVRGAIRQLEREGLVVRIPRRGATVARVSSKDALDCYDVRAALESVAARLAAERATKDALTRLTSTVDEGRRAIADERWNDMAELNFRFHQHLAEASENGELVSLIRHYEVRIEWIFSNLNEERQISSWDQHQDVLEAVIAGDASRAESAARFHITSSRELFVEGLRATPAVVER